MPTIDKRVVDMQFNNAQFEKNIATTQKSLSKFNEALNFKNASKGFDNINKASGKVNLSKLASGIEMISNRFSTLGIIGVTALQNITNKAVDAGFRIASALTSAITTGGKNRALNLEAAEFQLTGLLGEGAWDKIQEDINYGVKDTAYGLDAAAKVASQLAASQVQIGDNMKTALRSISGVAAMTNSTYEDIGSIYTTVAGNGRLMSEQLLQLSSRGLNAAATLGKYLGKSEAEVREMVSKGQIDFQTFAAAMDDAFGEHAKDANKTFEGALSNMKASLSRFGAAFYTPGLENMRDIFNALTPLFDSAKKALTPLIDEFNRLFTFLSGQFITLVNGIDLEKALSGKFDKPIEMFDFAFHRLFYTMSLLKDAVKSFLDPMKTAFSAIFPPIEITKDAIFRVTQAMDNAAKKFKANEEVSSKLERVYKGIFSIFSIGITIVKALGNAFKDILGKLAPVGSALLDIAAVIGDFLVKLNDSIKTSSTLSDVFHGLADLIGGITSNIADSLGLVSKGFDSMVNGSTEGAIALGDRVSTFLGKILNSLKDFIVGFAESFNLKNVFDTLNAALSGGFLIVLINAIDKIKTAVTKLLGNDEKQGNRGLIATFQSTVASVQTSLFELQNTLKAYRLIAIAGAIGILAFSLVQLSKVDPIGLARGLTGLSGVIAELVGALYLISLIEKNGAGVAKTSVLLLGLAFSVKMLSKAVVRLASLDLAGLVKGLAGVGILLAELSAAMKFTDFSKIKVGSMVGLILLASALNMMASVVTKLSGLDLPGLAKGLGSIGILLAAIAGFTHIVGNPKGLISTGIGLIAIATAINILAKGISALGGLSIEEIVKGLSAMGASLLIIAGTARLLPKDLMSKGAGLIFIAIAVNTLSKAVKTLGDMPIVNIGKGLIALGGSLVIIAGAMRLMQGAVKGALALNIVAGSLLLLAPVLVTLGSMSLESIGTSLLALAGTFAVLGIAAAALQPVIPAMIGLSASVALLGVGLGAAGAGILALSIGLAGLAASGGAAIVAIQTIVEGLANLIPLLLRKIGEGILALLEVVAGAGQTIMETVKTLITSVLDAIIQTAPKFGETIITLIQTICNVIISTAPWIGMAVTSLIQTFLAVVNANVPEIINTGMNLIIQFVQSLIDNAFMMGKAAVEAIAQFIRGIASNISKIIQAAIDLAISFVNGVANGIQNNQEPFKNAVRNLIKAIGSVISGLLDDLINFGKSIIDGLIKGIERFGYMIGDTLGGIVGGAVDFVKNLLGIHSPSRVFAEIGEYCVLGMTKGIEGLSQYSTRVAKKFANRTVDAFTEAISSISETMDTSYDLNPTITPVIDMTNVDASMGRIQSMFDTQRRFNIDSTVGLSKIALYRDNQNGSDISTGGDTTIINNYDMTQNNYSPKALSRIDIYRDTKSQFSRLKKVVNA